MKARFSFHTLPALFLAGALFLTSCSDDSDGLTGEDMISFDVKNFYDVVSDRWIFVSDPDGKPLGEQEITSHGVLTFKRPKKFKGDVVTVTMAEFVEGSFGRYRSFWSYTEVIRLSGN
jgi:hypothetical protein